MNSNTNNRGMSFTNAIASVLCIGMLGALAIPGLSQLKQSIEPTLCSNNLKGCMQGWNLYASVSNGKWPAMWDRSSPGSGSWGYINRQVPYIMWYFTKGEVPSGACYDSNQGGWWNPYTHQYGGFSLISGGYSSSDNPVYHCPTTEKTKGVVWQTPFNHELTNYTQAVYNVYNNNLSRWEYSDHHYAQPDLFTHSSTTLRICDLAESMNQMMYNAWATYSSFKAYNPHDGKGNYLFCDGHVELLTTEEFLAKGDQTFKPYLTGQEGN